MDVVEAPGQAPGAAAADAPLLPPLQHQQHPQQQQQDAPIFACSDELLSRIIGLLPDTLSVRLTCRLLCQVSDERARCLTLTGGAKDLKHLTGRAARWRGLRQLGCAVRSAQADVQLTRLLVDAIRWALRALTGQRARRAGLRGLCAPRAL
jgi:hypothetical protein